MVLQNMFSALSFLHYRKDDDFVDRLSYFYTSSFLIMMAVLVSFKQFGGRPLECWVPAQFTSSWEAYTEMFCWSENTYFVPLDEDVPVDAFLYYIPCLMWRLMSDKSGIRLNDIVQMATEKENIDPDYRIRTIESLSRHLEAALRYQHTATSRTQYTMHRVFKCFNLRYYESYVTGMYLATKVFYVGNVLTNLLLVNKFLETDAYSVYGLGVLRDLLFGRSWMESGNFPRVTLCDFEVRVLGNIQRHSVQCVLVINIFNEKIFILIWLWFSILFVVTTLDAMYWFSISLFHRDRFRFVLRHLELTTDPDRPELFRKEKRKQIDGVLVLRMIALHAGVMYCTEITDALWKRYLSQHPENLIEEDSALIHFARTQSIRRSGRSGQFRPGGGTACGSTHSLQPNHNGGSGAAQTETEAPQKLSRFLSYRQSGSFRLHRRGKRAGSRSLSKSRSPSPSAETSTGAPGSTVASTLGSATTMSTAATTVIQITPSSRPGSSHGTHDKKPSRTLSELSIPITSLPLAGKNQGSGTSSASPVFSRSPLRALKSVVGGSSKDKIAKTTQPLPRSATGSPVPL
ncbi:innexin domain-containing protein [Ditylenchus destructor]|uniref:Innexin n=1 Tax=Ditylenchus destructor TaxID=166010 RepID=A0AAD4MX37_9BILA|nr:innexin domain-containing protein [Ditylenchus destructor]